MATAGYRSLAAPWVGGAASPVPQKGYTSLLGFWIGGISSPPGSAPEAGYTSMLAFWAGGASGLQGTIEPPTEETPTFTGGYGARIGVDRYKQHRSQIIRDEQEIIQILAIISKCLH